MKEFDYIIIGGGCAGLSLAYELEIHEKLKNKTLSSAKDHVEPEDRNISLSFQENSLFPHYTVEKNINLGSEAKKLNGKKK